MLAGYLDPGLYLSDRNSRDEELFSRYACDPIQDGAMGARTAQLRDDVRVEEVHRLSHDRGVSGGGAAAAAA